jgi:hypothetical protein
MQPINQDNNSWKKINYVDFWAEIAPSEHVVQLYDNESAFLHTLEGFVGSGLAGEEGVIVIASSVHIKALNARLEARGCNVEVLVREMKYFPLDATKVLARFMVNGWPDEALFFDTVNELCDKARIANKRIRAFGEMVAILWQQGNYAATVHLEHLWNKFCSSNAMCLYCAYPKAGSTDDPANSMLQICKTHGKVISGWDNASNDIHYSQPA